MLGPLLHAPQQQPRLSAHHGDFLKPNQLAPAMRVADAHPEIDVFEIDFVDSGAAIVSAHDYDARAIGLGSALAEWIDEFAVRRRRVLWIDVKQNIDLYCDWAHGGFSTARLFAALEDARVRTPDLDTRVWLGCQDEALRDELLAYCRAHRWRFILDMPLVSGYVAQRLVPRCAWPCARSAVQAEMRDSELYAGHRLVSLDREFFAGPTELKRFVRELELQADTLLVLNSFDRRQARIEVEDVAIVMQYDYTT